MYPKINQNIVIELLDGGRTFRSIVSEVNDKEMQIGFPIDGNIIAHFQEGTRIIISFIIGENQYKFKTQILGRTRDNIPLLRIISPKESEIRRVQRRENFRMNANLKMIVNNDEVKTINISASGVLFTCHLDIPIDVAEIVTGKIFVPSTVNKDLEVITFQGRVIRIDVQKKEERKYIALEFTNIGQKDQMKIIQYCFDMQRKLR